MKAYVCICNFGTADQKRDICEKINALTMYHSYVNDTGNIVIPCKVTELGDLLEQLAKYDETNWIEYAVSFDL